MRDDDSHMTEPNMNNDQHDEDLAAEIDIDSQAITTMIPSTNTIPSSQKSKVRALPWIIMFAALYTFALPYIYFAIVQRYFLNPDWKAALPGLDSTLIRKWSMGGHMAAGVVCLLLGPLQFVPLVRKSWPRIHRWSGRIYCICAIISCIFGLVFIVLKRELVGGYNMSIAFATFGVTVGVLSVKAWQTARAARAGVIPDFTAHRNWGIRSYSQILAPLLYRYWYVGLELFNVYDAPLLLRWGGVCRADDVCPDYLRWFDMVHCWTYWLTALGNAELIIYCLRKDMDVVPSSADFESNEPESQAPLLLDGNTLTYTVDNEPNEPRDLETKSVMAINVIGWVLAAITAIITIKTFT